MSQGALCSAEIAQDSLEGLFAAHGPRRPWTYWLVLASVVGALVSPVLAAQDTVSGKENRPPLWRQAADKITNGSHYWATGLINTLTVYNVEDQALGSLETYAELELADGQPVWKRKRQKKTGQPGMVITIDLGIQKDPGTILAEYDSWILLRMETLDGTRVQVWKGVSSEDPRNTATAYLNESNALPLQIIFTLPYSSILGTQSISLTVKYKAAPVGAWLPWRAVVDQTGRIFFQKRRIHIETEFSNWRPIPHSLPTDR
ncbi:MAG: hypothetical protein HYV95_11635 [Opitutae bacterium]|nr:hypothetical protein [Opitutae bacterium]